jgi:hypothetical protein
MNPVAAHPEPPSGRASSALTWAYRTLLLVDGVIAAVIVGFFGLGLVDGSVSAYNAGIWFVILVALVLIIGGAVVARRMSGPGLALLPLSLLAVPGLLFLLMLLLALLLQPRWN